jgi:peptidoglycan hydrolase-like protein with peptidoglycan-binding domain
VKENIMVAIVRLMVLIGIAVSLGACSDEQVPPAKSPTIYPADSAIVRKVQIALRNRGYYASVVDGFLGQSTALSIQRFQVDHDQVARPYIDRPLLVSLGISTR